MREILLGAEGERARAASSPSARTSPLARTLPVLYTIRYTMRDSGEELVVLVDRRSEEPIYEQIAREIRTRIAAGRLAPGAGLPPVRTLASDLGLNLNTVARAYRVLQEEGFVRIRDRMGVEVAAPAGRAGAEESRRLGAELEELLARMRQAGLSPEEIRRMAGRKIAGLGGRPGKSGGEGGQDG